MGKKWVAAMKTGAYSDTYIFLSGSYDTKEEAEKTVCEIFEKMAIIYDQYQRSENDNDYGMSMLLQEEYEKLVGDPNGYFPPRPREEWESIVAQVGGGTFLRLF